MKTVLMLAVFVFPLAFGETACGRGIDGPAKIVKVQRSGERGGWLGVSIQDMTRRLAKEMDTKTTEGALVNDVVENSPAGDAGIKNEDIIVDVDGRKITDADELREAIRTVTPDTKVSVTLMRKGEKKTLIATIGKQPRSRSYSYPFTSPDLPHIPRAPRVRVFVSTGALGMELSPLNEQLGKYFDAPNGKGVLVNEVEEGGKAEKAGFMAGDVITRVGKETIEEVRDVHHALRDYKKGEKADVEIIRKGTKKTLTIEVPDTDRRRRSHFGLAPHGNWLQELRELDLGVDSPDVDWELEDHQSLKNDLNEFKRDLRDLGREIQAKAKRLQEELKAKFNQVIS